MYTEKYDYYTAYYEKEYFDILKAVKKLPRNAVITADYFQSTMIPAYTGKKTYIGHWAEAPATREEGLKIVSYYKHDIYRYNLALEYITKNTNTNYAEIKKIMKKYKSEYIIVPNNKRKEVKGKLIYSNKKYSLLKVKNDISKGEKK